MVDLQKPCVKCGAVDRNKFGQCSPCRKRMRQTYSESAEGRAKINATRRKYSHLGKVREKQKARLRKFRESAEGRAKIKACDLRRRESAEGRERLIAAKEKFKKRQFEFSLQTQQKVIEQCQPKST